MTFTGKPKSEGDLRSPAFPGGTLIRALLDRRLMGLADLGGSSARIGDRWSDIVSDHIDSLVGREVVIPGGGSHRVEQVIRLDALPHVAHAASKRSLQNPDFVLLGNDHGRRTMQASDAKFSIETARSRQVSVEVLAALAEVGLEYTDLLGDWHPDGTIVPGLFFAPQSALTSYVLSGGRGITRSTIKPEEVVLLDVSAVELTAQIPGAGARQRLAVLDRLDGQVQTELLLGLYYTRLSSAAGASWFDMHRPLFGPSDLAGPDFDQVDREIARRATQSRNGYDLISGWAIEAEDVRADRLALNQAAGLPLPNRELREWTAADASSLGVEPPSLNRVRKELQRWVHNLLIAEVGVIEPGQDNLAEHIAQFRALVGQLLPGARIEVTRIVEQLGSASDFANGRIQEVERGQEYIAE